MYISNTNKILYYSPGMGILFTSRRYTSLYNIAPLERFEHITIRKCLIYNLNTLYTGNVTRVRSQGRAYVQGRSQLVAPNDRALVLMWPAAEAGEKDWLELGGG